ncbi:hypothetical protein S7711_09907 [Stachybotrys chartarum IBT 7711]|uniref:Zn(2)-C6 fungal-type domain-containing protein n=1 Tax=Stachybotrys chartarum (strain CBS 109288 / IBT 7711) TaxID=1280523 RepID=A0A084AEW6_STACB|nr:hypothetical protein S7711_09907 [Stachybotrys chartarum IBT 7711]KFA45412.1 hypothetical protein S40293_09947 [Stachybotrys chartarum IBT 40293]
MSTLPSVPDDQPPQRAVRLRLACDACSTTKVKCDKARPACQRCITNDLLCVYSVSRRHGSQPWYRRMQQRQPQDQYDCQSTLLRHSSIGHPISTYFPSLPTPATAGLPSPGNKWWDAFEFPLGEETGTADVLMHNDDDISSHALSLCDSSSSTKPSPIGAGPNREHDCEGKATEALRSLHYRPDYFGMPSGRSTSADETDSPSLDDENTALSVDKIIIANRAALAILPNLLDCPCARYPHLALLYISILCKILFWYRVAVSIDGTRRCTTATTDCEDQVGRRQTDGLHTASSVSSESSTARSNAFHVQPMKIQLGELQLDGDDQTSLQNSILLKELRKMDKTLQKLRELDVSWAADDAKVDQGASATHWYRLSTPKIGQEIKVLLQIAMENRDKAL